MVNFIAGFDWNFIMQYLTKHGIKADPLHVGTRIMGCNIMSGKIFLKDFINYQGNQSLEKVSKAYKVDSVIKKGCFPYKLIKPEFYGLKVKGHPLALRDYEPDKINDPKKRQKLLDWHHEESTKLPESSRGFDFAEAILEYNYNDTLLLTASCLKYIESCFELEDKLSNLVGLPYRAPGDKDTVIQLPKEKPEFFHTEGHMKRVLDSHNAESEVFCPSNTPYRLPKSVWKGKKKKKEKRGKRGRKKGEDTNDDHEEESDKDDEEDEEEEDFDSSDDDDDDELINVYPGVIHPFSPDCITSSSYGLMLLRKYIIGPGYLGKLDQLPIIKEQHLEGFAKSSFAELEYFAYLMKTNPNIQCFLNTGEVTKLKCGPHTFQPDGYDPKTKTVYNFHGCYWHGCHKCVKNPRSVNALGIDVTEVRERDKKRQEWLLSNTEMVSHVHTMWECEWRAFVEEDEEAKKHVEEFQAEKKLHRLDWRKCFKGGNTDCYAIYMSAALLREIFEKQLGPDATEEERRCIDTIYAYMIDYTSQVNVIFIFCG